MPQFVPPQIEVALTHLREAFHAVEGRELDVQKTPWSEIERSIIKLLGGAFRADRPEHQAIALGLAGVFGARLQQEHGAFWFPNREALESASLGFPGALMVLPPYAAVVDALSRANLPKLEAVSKEIGLSLSQVRFSAANLEAAPLTPQDYQRIFDPGFIQFVALSADRAKAAWESNCAALAKELQDGVGRLPASFPQEAKKKIESQLVSALNRLDPQASLVGQVEKAPRLVELIGHLFGTTASTGSAPEELWENVILPLLYIGAPQQFPPLEDRDLSAYREGLDPFLLFVDVVPYQSPAEEDGALGVFAPGEISLAHPALESVGPPRLLKLRRERLRPALQAFDAAKSRDAVSRFAAYLEQQAGQPPSLPRNASLLDASLKLLTDLQAVVAASARDSADLCLRQLTEAEAASEAALDLLRRSVQGPKIILLH